MITNNTTTMNTLKGCSILKKNSTIHVLALASAIALTTFCVHAGPTGQASKVAAKAATKVVVGKTIKEGADRAAREGAEKVAREAAGKIARETAERAAVEAAEAAVARQTKIGVVRAVARPANIVAAGAGTALVVAGGNVTTGAKHTMDGLGKGLETIAEKSPEQFVAAAGEFGHTARSVADATKMGIALIAMSALCAFFWKPLCMLRTRIADFATEHERHRSKARRSSHAWTGDGEVIDVEVV